MTVRNRISPLEYDPGSVVYEHVRRIVAGYVRRAVSFGYDEMEAASAANFAFADALASWDENKGDFVRWVRKKVKYAIMDTARYRAYKRLPQHPDQDAFDPPDEAVPLEEEDPPFDLTRALLSMSDDARAFVAVTLDPPESVIADAKRLGWTKDYTRGQEAAKYRQAVYNFFRESGWNSRRVGNAYLEACRALGGKK